MQKTVQKLLNIIKQKYSDPAVNTYCSEFEVNNFIISKFILKKLIPLVGISPYPFNELQLMVSAVCYFKPTHIFEWGTNIGKSARIFYETSKAFKLNINIYSTDLPDDVFHEQHPGKKRGHMVKKIKDISLLQGDGLKCSRNI